VAAVIAPEIAEFKDPYPFLIYLINCGIAVSSSYKLRQIPISIEAEKDSIQESKY